MKYIEKEWTPISTEQCLKQIPNRFKMILVAVQRARELERGAVSKVPSTNKPVITALKELAEGKITVF